MYAEDSTGIGVVVSPPNTAGRWDDEDICALYLNLLTHGWLDPEAMPIRMAEYYGTKLGHYGRLALEARLALAHQETVAAGFKVIAGAFGSER